MKTNIKKTEKLENMKKVQQKAMIEKIISILQKYSFYREAIAFCLLIYDYETIEMLLDRASNRKHIIDYEYLLRLTEIVVEQMKDDLIVKCFN